MTIVWVLLGWFLVLGVLPLAILVLAIVVGTMLKRMGGSYHPPRTPCEDTEHGEQDE